ncbi:MAG: hypothetical protein DRR19_24110 [Candidatus Parabeggiatoa sp. nov. 1]|nr:MAG: hypothetical protein DRR19_24110 [Gammaproteobacteria bacterium]
MFVEPIPQKIAGITEDDYSLGDTLSSVDDTLSSVDDTLSSVDDTLSSVDDTFKINKTNKISQKKNTHTPEKILKKNIKKCVYYSSFE